MPASLLSALVQTRSLELVLAPIASHVSHLIIANEACDREGAPLPDLTPSAAKIEDAVKILVHTGQKLASESTDEDLKGDMPVSCKDVTEAGQQIKDAAQLLKKDPFSSSARFSLVDGARNILEGTMKVLLVSDEAEIRKIVRAAHWVMDRLGLVEAVTSLRGLLVSFKSYTESLMLLASLCDKRQRELTSPNKRDRLIAAMMVLKKSIPMLSSCIQISLKHPTNLQAKASRDYVVGQILLACTEVIRVVESRADDDEDEPGLLATNLQKIQHKLSSSGRRGSELDSYVDAIVRNSMAVAHDCQDISKREITDACQSVLQAREDLSELQSQLVEEPMIPRSRRELDLNVEKLSAGFKQLDNKVTSAVLHEISDVFTNSEEPIHNLVLTAATSKHSASARGLGISKELDDLRKEAQKFQTHAAKLSQVAKHAASLSADARRVRVVRATAVEVEKLVPQVVAGAVAVYQNPKDIASIEHLTLLRKEWASKVHLLSVTVDEIIDLNELLTVVEGKIRDDVGKVKEAILDRDANLVSQICNQNQGRGQRVTHLSQREMANTADPMHKSRLQAACLQLQAVIPEIQTASDKLSENINSTEHQSSIVNGLATLADKVQILNGALKRSLAPPIDMSGIREQLPEINQRKYHEAQVESVLFMPKSWQMASGSGRTMPSLPQDLESEDDEVYQRSRRSLNESKPRYKPEKSLDRKIKMNKLETPVSKASVKTVETAKPSHLFDDVYFDNEDTELGAANKNTLLGLGSGRDLPQLLSGRSGLTSAQVSKPSQTASAPVTRLLKAAFGGSYPRVEAQCNELLEKSQSLRDYAEGTADKSRNPESAKLVLVTATEIEKLTPMIIQAAKEVASNPKDVVAIERLNVIGREWAAKVHVLSEVIDDLVMPWSASVAQLAFAASSGDAHSVQRQAERLSSHVTRLKELGEAARKAADVEDSVDAGGEDAPARDPASLQRVEQVRLTAGLVDKLTPQIIEAAKVLSRNPSDVKSVEALEHLRREWATKVHGLVFAVDDVTVGTSAPVEALSSLAGAGDRGGFQERARLLASYVRTLKDMASSATSGCNDTRKIHLVEITIPAIEKITAELLDTARQVTDLAAHDKTTVDEHLTYMTEVEKMGLLQREWASKAHLLTALVDDLTAEVSAPVDRLAGAALAVSRTEEEERQRQQENFEDQAQELLDRVARVRSHASSAVEKSRQGNKVRTVRVTGDFIDRLTPQVIAAAKALADNPDQPTVEHFQMLRRQWASKAQLLMATLDQMPDADFEAVQAVIQDLLGSMILETSTSFESLVDEDDAVSLNGRILPHTPMQLQENSEAWNTFTEVDSRRLPPKPKPKPRLSHTHSEEDSMSETRWMKGPRGCSSETDLLKRQMIEELNERLSESESSQDFSPLHHSASITGPGVNWRTASEEDLIAQRSYHSLAAAAQLLQDETDKWEEDNNSIVQVAKKMSLQMMEMAEYTRGRRGELQTKTELINTAKAIAANGKVIVKFAQAIADQCMDKRSRDDLLYAAEFIPTMSTQLRIISSVKAATPEDSSADVMLVKNAENLMQAVVRTLKTAEVACVKGISDKEANNHSMEQSEATSLVFQWKKKLRQQRTLDALHAQRGQLGLRKRNKHSSTPSLVDLVQV